MSHPDLRPTQFYRSCAFRGASCTPVFLHPVPLWGDERIEAVAL